MFKNIYNFVLLRKRSAMFERKQVSLGQLPEVAHELPARFPEARVFAFYGRMGAGKTTLIRELCRAFHSPDLVTSPTFAIINEYAAPAGVSIYHFDFYRIRKLEEVFDLGYEDYFFSGHYCLIEWPEMVESLLPEKHIRVNLSDEGNSLRTITAVVAGESF